MRMKFGQLIEYNMRNICLEIHTKNVVERLFLDPFLKKSKLSISLKQKLPEKRNSKKEFPEKIADSDYQRFWKLN